ncbi:MAG TPA: methyltransferase [Vicinamibacterales bacterium]|nr:methyltransferase [Vicinamibacterales bacterium]
MSANQSKPADIWTLGDLATPWSIHVVVTLRIAQHIASGRQQIDDLARAAGADADSLHRVLRHLVHQGIFEEPAVGTFALNDAARPLLDDGVMLGFDLDSFGGRMAHAWNTLLTAVRTGRPAYHEVFGRPFWDDLAAHPALAERFDALMGPQGHGIPDPEVLVSGDWSKVRTVADIGGGTGALLAEVLRTHPEVHGILVDQPATIARAETRFREAGLIDRVTLAAQSFFDPLPAGADLYLLKSVLGDWPDREAEMILRRCAAAARPAGRVVLDNEVSPDGHGGHGGPAPELLMMVLVGGRARSLSEFRPLAHRAGLEVAATGKRPSGRFTVECVPAATVTESKA